MMQRRTRRAGFTLLEAAIATSIFALIGYSLTVCMATANDSQRTVFSVAAQDRALREATSTLTDELRTSSDSMITVTTLADSNSQVDLQMPVESGGNLLWGVYDRSLGATYADQNKVGWKLRYTVRNVDQGVGGTDRQLVRQILDTGSVVRDEKVVATGLNSGANAQPGFKVVKSGSMWVVTVSTSGHSAGTSGVETQVHVRTRN